MPKVKSRNVLIGPHLDTDCDIEPTIITDIDEQRRRVLEHLVNNFSTFKPVIKIKHYVPRYKTIRVKNSI